MPVSPTIRIGVGGWTFEPWRGVFYPPGLTQKCELEYAAAHLNTIEINATYYGRQKPTSFTNWAAAAPDGFKFSVKASRYSMQRKLLAEGGDSVKMFLEQGFTELGDRLGPILWQFAATKRFEPDDFARFLELIPDMQDGVSLRHVLEVRHASFVDPSFVALARARNMAIAFADSDAFPQIDEATADFSYARLQRAVEACATGYDAPALDAWATHAQAWGARGDAYVFFISGAKVRNPLAALALIERLRQASPA